MDWRRRLDDRSRRTRRPETTHPGAPSARRGEGNARPALRELIDDELDAPSVCRATGMRQRRCSHHACSFSYHFATPVNDAGRFSEVRAMLERQAANQRISPSTS